MAISCFSMDSSTSPRSKGGHLSFAFRLFERCRKMSARALALVLVRGSQKKAMSTHAAQVTKELLERILEYLIEDEGRSTAGLRALVAASRVNRHWHSVVQKVLYRSITVTSARQLKLLLRTVTAGSTLGAAILSISVPRVPYIEPPSYRLAKMRITDEQRAKDLQAKNLECMDDLISLLKLPSNLDSLLLHSDAFDLFPESQSLNPAQPMPQINELKNLSSVKGLTLLGDYTSHRWLWLIPFVTDVEIFFGVPCWLKKDEAILIPPITSWSTRSLTLKAGSLSDGMSLDMFKSIITPPLRTSLSLGPCSSMLQNLDLQDTLVLGSEELPGLLLGMTELRRLRLHSHDRKILKNLASSLALAIPKLLCLQTLDTNAIAQKPDPGESISSFPPSLHILVVSLDTIKDLQVDGDKSFPQPPTVGTIRRTIRRVLKIAQGSQLRSLTVKDCLFGDFLHFNIAGSADYGDSKECEAQNRMWLQASQMNVLIDVVKPELSG